MMKKLFSVIILCIFSYSAEAQLGSSGIADARSSGLAGTYSSMVKGSYAIGINPANIIMPQHRGDLIFILPFPQVHLRAGSNIMTINDMKYYFGGVNGEPRILSDADVRELYNKFEGDGEINFGAAVNMVSFSFNLPDMPGTVGFSINDMFAGNAVIPDEAAELPLLGNELNRLYTFNNADFKSWWIRNYSLSYARDLQELKPDFLDKLYAGISVKLIHGFMYAGSETVNSYLITGDENALEGKIDFTAHTSFSEDIGIQYDFDPEDRTENNLQIFPAPAGSGFGFDLGVSAVYQKNWNFSFSLTDIGSITWKKRTAKFYSRGEIIINDLTDADQRDSVKDAVESDGEYINEFTSGLPFALRAGASYLYKNLLIGLDFNQGFNNLPGNSTVPRFSVAGDWMPAEWISLRMGLSAGGLDGFNWAAGLGVQSGVIEFNISTTDFLFIPAPNDTKQVSVAINSRWRFR